MEGKRGSPHQVDPTTPRLCDNACRDSGSCYNSASRGSGDGDDSDEVVIVVIKLIVNGECTALIMVAC